MSDRLDQALAARGLARSRTHAQRLVAAGAVRVDGRVATKPSAAVEAEALLEVDDDGWVSRAAGKLLAALDAFGVDPAGRDALDVGASTGGFTQVLLARGARHVTALDVGHGQFRVPLDDRITLLEGVNVRDLTPPLHPMPSLIVADVSFISLVHVLPPVRAVATDDADWLVLVKPQFEVGRGRVRGGIVDDAEARADAIDQVLAAAWSLGLGTAGIAASPVVGTHGNREFLAHLRAGAPDPAHLAHEARILARSATGDA
ncbi:TlyA family rRNA (cytidine-2'-O)-methyltransferase [Agrococcus versicolor]|uniref:TlyA family rRNA (Cytidine-2'-O)-methyltransferase n=1 Tax=Agrococcus versicolor TaxID=501482 RepID=A0ABN3AV16_9MICO